LPKDSVVRRIIEFVVAFFLVAALVGIQVLIGGTRMLFAFPSYALLIAAAILSVALWRAPRPSPHQICLVSALVFFGYIAGRALLSPTPYLARYDLTAVAAGALVYLLTNCVLTSAKIRMSILAALLAAALVHVLVGAIQVRSGNNFMPISFLQRFDYGRRASGFYVCPNHLAGLLEVLGVFGLSIVCWSRWPAWGKLLVGYATAICYLGVILSGSRGGYLSVFASWCVFAVLALRVLRAAESKLVFKVGFAGAVIAVLAIGAAVFFIRQTDYLRERTANAVADRAFRFDMWQAAIEQSKLNPILGTGARTYQYYGRMFRSERMQADPIYAHGDYVQLLAEYGAVGAGAFLFFFAAHLGCAWADSRRLGPKRIAASQRLRSNAMALNIGALCVIAAYVVHSVVDFNLHIPANVLLLCFIGGIMANPGVVRETNGGKQTGLIIWKLLLVVLAGGLAFLVWRWGPGEYFAERSRTALRDNRFLTATDYALRGLEREQENPLLYYYLGRARILGGDLQKNPQAAASFYEASLPALTKASELAPLDETYTLELAFTLDLLKRFAEAEWFYEQAHNLDPKSKSIHDAQEWHLRRWRDGETPPN
jgi:O-antigen ligase